MWSLAGSVSHVLFPTMTKPHHEQKKTIKHHLLRSHGNRNILKKMLQLSNFIIKFKNKITFCDDDIVCNVCDDSV
jgi:hypothetical protein